MVKLINNYYENGDDRAVNYVDDAEWMVALILTEKYMQGDQGCRARIGH